MPREEESVRRHARAAEEFNRHEHREDGAQAAGSLAGGLDVLRESLYFRVHLDVQQVGGVDSMLIPVSKLNAQQQARTEIELFEVAESAATVRECGYVATSDDWYLQWLARLRLGDACDAAKHVQRLEDYLGKTPDERRLAFIDVLAEVLPYSRRAPLVLFQLAPLAVRIVTALAFGDHTRAREARNTQARHLPAIHYCRRCQGEVLENGERCEQCGNPLWDFKWLTATD
jgi:hypothetical protein